MQMQLDDYPAVFAPMLSSLANVIFLLCCMLAGLSAGVFCSVELAF